MHRVSKAISGRNELERTAPEAEDMAELVGGFIHYWGFKRLHGKIWTHIYISSVPLDASALMARVKASKANVSTALKDLLTYEVIKEGPPSPWGTRTYVANEAVIHVILNVLRRREMKMLAALEVACGLLNEVPGAERVNFKLDEERMKKLKSLVDLAKSQLQMVLTLAAVDMADWKEF